jgi:hypothetical protein
MLVACLAACGTDGGSANVHDLTTCDATWGSAAQPNCEAACEAKPTLTGGCANPASTCPATFVADDGEQGCCIAGKGSGSGTIRFVACD